MASTLIIWGIFCKCWKQNGWHFATIKLTLKSPKNNFITMETICNSVNHSSFITWQSWFVGDVWLSLMHNAQFVQPCQDMHKTNKIRPLIFLSNCLGMSLAQHNKAANNLCKTPKINCLAIESIWNSIEHLGFMHKIQESNKIRPLILCQTVEVCH